MEQPCPDKEDLVDRGNAGGFEGTSKDLPLPAPRDPGRVLAAIPISANLLTIAGRM